MTENSKTVQFERRAGDSSALYYMHDWMIVLVLAVVAILTVWAAVIIYDYIQTARGKMRKKDVVDIILETEDEGTTSEEKGPCVDSTEKHEDVVPETTEGWETNGWRRNRLEWSSTIKEEAENFEEIPVTNEHMEQIEMIPIKNSECPETSEVPVTSEDVEKVEMIPTTTNEVEHQVEMIPTLTNSDVERTQEECELYHLHTIDTLGRPGVSDTKLAEPQVDDLCGTAIQLRECPGDDLNLHVHSNDNPVDMLTDPDIEGPNDFSCEDPGNVCGVAVETHQHLDVAMTSSVSTDIIFSDADLPEVLPEHLCEAEIVEVECQGDTTHHVASETQEVMTEMVLINDLNKSLPDYVCDTEMEEVKYLDIARQEDVANIPQDKKVAGPFTDHQSEMEKEEVQCPDEDIRNRAEPVNTLEVTNLPERGLTDFSHEDLALLLGRKENLECADDASSQVELGDPGNKNVKHINDVQLEVLGIAHPYNKKICGDLEHPSENLTEKASDPELQELDHVCKEEMQEVESDVSVCSRLENGRRDGSEGTACEPDLKPDYVRGAVIEVQCSFLEFNVTQFAAEAIKTQDERPGVVSSQTEHVSGVKSKNGEFPDADLSKHTKEVPEYAALDIDMGKGTVEEPRHTDCDLHSRAVEGLSDEPTAARSADVDTERDVELGKQSVDTRKEESHKKIEINIMEATMEHNEWMAVSGADTESPADFHSGSSGLSCVRYRAEIKKQPIDSHCGSVDSYKFGAAGIVPGSTDGGLQGKKMAAVLPIKTETVRVRFCVHYHTDSPWQELAVTGDQPELGNWKGFVSLERGQDGFWVSSVSLPVERQLEWKFVLVEDGRIRRWEECENRCLETGRGGEEMKLNKCWGLL